MKTWLSQRTRRDLPAEFAETVADPSVGPPRLDLAEELQLALDRFRVKSIACAFRPVSLE